MKPDVSSFLVGVLPFALGAAAIGQTIALVPKSSTGAYFLAGDEIITTPGSIVTLEFAVYGWGQATGNPSFGAAQGTADPAGYLGVNALPPNPGKDLLPLGYALPDPAGGSRRDGLYVVQNTCTISKRDCTTGQGPACEPAEGFCVPNPRWIICDNAPLAVLENTSLSNYLIGGVACAGSVLDVGNLEKSYLGTLRLMVPGSAEGTYGIGLSSNSNSTFMVDQFGVEIPGLTTVSARITVVPGLGPQPAYAPYDVVKNRYVSFVPLSGDLPQAYQVRLASSTHNPSAVGFTGWVGVPSIGLNPSSAVQSAPVFRVWNESILHVGDCEIQPGATYEIRATTDGVTFSEPLTVTTSAQPSGGKDWGDITGVNNGTTWTPPNGIANVNDILAIRSFITQIDPIPPFYRVNLQAISTADSCLNSFVNTADTFMAILAVSGQPYPFVDAPAMCPVCP